MKLRWIFLAIALGAASLALAEDKPVATSTAGMTREEIELAKYLEVLEDMELLEDWDFLELLSVLEDEE